MISKQRRTFTKKSNDTIDYQRIDDLVFLDEGVETEVRRQSEKALRSPLYGPPIRELSTKYWDEIDRCLTAPVSVRKSSKGRGWGLFADVELVKDQFVGLYAGLVRPRSRLLGNVNAYCFNFPACQWFWRAFTIDAKRVGNEMRFVNHSHRPNLRPMCVEKEGILRVALVANCRIDPLDELTFNYGPWYWVNRDEPI